jgi:hypothetical protein
MGDFDSTAKSAGHGAARLICQDRRDVDRLLGGLHQMSFWLNGGFFATRANRWN